MSAIFFRTAIVFFVLTISMKLMGKREIGELEVGELISALLISEICSIPIDDPNMPILNAIVPVAFIVTMEIILSFIKNKSRRLKRIVDGNGAYLIKDHKLSQNALRENRISVEEFYSALRQNGFGSINGIKHCILEANGKISVIEDGVASDLLLIIDGEINENALKMAKLTHDDILFITGGEVDGIFLMTYTDDGSYKIIKEEKR